MYSLKGFQEERFDPKKKNFLLQKYQNNSNNIYPFTEDYNFPPICTG